MTFRYTRAGVVDVDAGVVAAKWHCFITVIAIIKHICSMLSKYCLKYFYF